MSIKLGFEPLLSGAKPGVESEVTDGTEGFEVDALAKLPQRGIAVLRSLLSVGNGQ